MNLHDELMQRRFLDVSRALEELTDLPLEVIAGLGQMDASTAMNYRHVLRHVASAATALADELDARLATPERAALHLVPEPKVQGELG